MAEAALREEAAACSDTRWVLGAGGLSGADEGHLTALDCRGENYHISHVTVTLDSSVNEMSVMSADYYKLVEHSARKTAD